MLTTRFSLTLLFATPALLIAQSATTTSLTTAPNPSTFGQNVTLTATVSNASATGTVTFYNGVAVLGDALVASGQAVFTTTMLPSGTDSLKARYTGDVGDRPSISTAVLQAVAPAAGIGFKTKAAYGTDLNAEGLAMADLNGDGIADLVAANGDGTVNVFIGNANGTFQTPASYSVGATAVSVAAADFNGDGFADLAVVNQSGHTVIILLNDGTGAFSVASSLATGSFPSFVAIGDFNNDGFADLAITNYGSNSVTLLLGDGTGGFTAALGSPLSAGSGPSAVAVTDLNGDGFPDLVTTNYSDDTASIFLGDGTGAFTATLVSPYSVGTGPVSLAVGDLNGDGFPDFVVADQVSSGVFVMLGDGAGGFSQAAGNPFSVLSAPTYVALGDFNGDGTLDVATSGAGSISVFLGNGDGSLQVTAATYGTDSTTALVAGNLNGDGVADLAAADTGGSDTVDVLLGIAATSTSLMSSLNPSTYGVSVTFTATLSPSSATGTVTFKDGATVLGSGAVTIVSGVATLALTNLSVGTHSVTAVYSGDANNAPGTSAALTETVLGASAITLISSANPSTHGTALTFTATVNPLSATGTVTFRDGSSVLGAGAVTLTSGVATLTLSTLAVGSHSITAAYSGDASNAAITSSALIQSIVNATTTTLISSSNPSTHGNSVTFTATLAPLSSTGTVTFLDGSTVLGSGAVTLSGGTATVSVPTLSVGSHSVTAAYSGDANDASSTSAALTETVLGASAITLISSPNPSTHGTALTFTATLNPLSATGAVTFRDGATVLGSGAVTVTSGVASVTLSTLAVGSHSVTAAYGGDTNNAAVTSSALIQSIVNATTTSLISSANPSTHGNSVTFTATLAPLSATGTVAFLDGSTVLGSGPVTLSGGTAALSISALSVGSHSITAAYSGDANDAAGTSPILTQTVLGASTITLTSSANPSALGSSVVFTATLSPPSATGTVTFLDGSTVLGSGAVMLSGGVASLALSTLTVGSHSITAVYSGDATNAADTSSILIQVVNALAGITLTSSVTPATYGSAVILTATLVPNTATGKVTFYDGVTDLATEPVVNGQAVLTTYQLQTGGGQLKARYLGDASNGAASSAALPQTVNALPTGGFQASVNVTAGSNPAFVAVGDFNRDGIEDVVAADVSGGQVTVLLGTGGGSFATPASYAVGTQPVAIAMADFNGDGISDLAVANSGSNKVSVLRGNSDGSFQAAVSLAVGAEPSFVVAADFNGDGNADLVVVNTSDNNLSVLLGHGDGTFANAVTYATGAGPLSAAVSDFNGDGVADLAVTNSADNNVGILLGSGDGTFLAQTVYGGGSTPESIATGDFNGDGLLDLAVANHGGGNVSVLLGNGNGTFAGAANYATGVHPKSVAVADVNGDGNSDLVVANLSDNSVTLIAGNGNGSFQAPVNYSVGQGPSSVAVGDFAGNGRVSLATANASGDNVTMLLATVPLLPTTTTLTSSANPSVFGQSITLIATLSPLTATGSVTFFDGATNIGVSSLANGTATLLVSSLSVASHSLTAVYGGDSADMHSTSAVLTQIVGQGATITTLTSSQNPVVYGQAVILTATLSPSSATGIVTFLNGGTSLGTGILNNGVATFSSATLPPGTLSLSALYSGDADDATSTSSSVDETVNKVATTTTLMSSANPSAFGQSVTLTAAVSPSTAAGSVTFMDGSTVLGTVVLSSGVAIFTSAQLSVGAHSITAAYGGAADDAASTSTVLSQQVSQAPNTTVLMSSLNPSTFGQGITLTATVSPTTATGNITFKDGSTVLGSAQMSSGVATLALTTLTTGAHSLTAVYGGDTNDVPSTSPVLLQTVNAGSTTTTLTSSMNPVNYGQALTLTASVSPATATGTITFTDGSTVLLTTPLANGAATLATQTLASGTHTLTAVYNGDVSDVGSTGSVSLQVEGCGTVTESSIFVDSVGGPQTVTITSSAPSCAWNASTTSPWIQLSPSSGTGSGALIATILQNATGVERAGTIEIGDQAIAITQRITATIFSDVPPSAYYFDSVNMLYAKQITSGCSSSPPQFCPDLSIPRWEMAVFVVRAVYDGDNFTASPVPYFNDVPAGSPGFAWIQKMYELGISSGCGNGDFCPSAFVPREQMAVFTIRLRYGASAVFDFPATPYFTDVTPSTFGWSWIQRMREDTITGGCSPTLFCPSTLVTRAEMAVFVMLAGFNEVLATTTPAISSINPATITHGLSGLYTVTGVSTNFVQATTYLAPMPGITIGPVTVNSPTSLTVQLTAASSATLQPVSVLAITGNPPGNEEAVLPNSLTIQ